MKTFTDTAGRTWSISLTLGTAMAVKARLGVDLLQPEQPYRDPSSSETSAKEEPLLTRLGTDEMLLGEVLCCLLERQFETHEVSEDDVRNSFDGQTLLAAQRAFYEELIDFFHSRGRRDRARAVAKQMDVVEKAITAIETRIEGLNADTLVDEAMAETEAETDLSRRSQAETDGPTSGESQAPSESTPGR